MSVIKFSVLFLCCVVSALGIIDSEEPTTKPPRHRENLPWPSRPQPQFRATSRVKTSQRDPARSELVKALTSQAPPSTTSSTLLYLSSPSPPTNQRPGYGHTSGHSYHMLPKLPVAVVLQTKQPLCPYKATGLFPYLPDCRRFINCFKGRGVVQPCAPGTLFNPLTQECDYPAKVSCLESTSDYRILPVNFAQHHEDFNTQEHHTRQERSNTTQNEDWKKGFKSYRVVQQPVLQSKVPLTFVGPQGPHVGVQPPYRSPNPSYSGQPVLSPMLRPPAQLMPSPMLQPPPPPVNQPYSVGIPFNIPPMMFNNQPSVSYGSANPVKTLWQPVSRAQNQPGYPESVQPSQQGSTIYPIYQNPSQNQLDYSQNPLRHITNSSQMFSGSRPAYPQNNQGVSPGYHNLQYPQSYPQNSQSSQYPQYNPQPGNSYWPEGQPNIPRSQSQIPSTSPQIGIKPNYFSHVQPMHNPGSYSGHPGGGIGIPQNPVIVYPTLYNPGGQQQQQLNPQNSPNPYPEQGNQPLNSPGYYTGVQPKTDKQFSDYPEYDPTNPQSGRESQTINTPEDPLSSRGFRKPQDNPQPGPNPGYPLSRKPEIFPQGGQPGYFLVNQNSNENEPPTNRQPIQPPKYNPVDSSRSYVKCPHGASGLFPHPDCFKFLNCDHGRTFVMSCGPGTAFNPEISTCDYPENVDCGRSVPDSESDPYPNIDPTPFPPYPHKGGSSDIDSTELLIKDPYSTEHNDEISQIDENPSASDLVEILDIRGSFDQTPEPRATTTERTTTTTERTTTTKVPTLKSTKKPTRGQREHLTQNEPKIPFPTQPPKLNLDIQPEKLSPSSNIPVGPPKRNIALRNEPPPISKQLVRLRGGQRASEGYLELRGLKEWGMVCDKRGEWTLNEANIVCKQLGYERGAELTWQGRPSDGSSSIKLSVAFTSVHCSGNETNILDCLTKNDKQCDPELDAVWVRCRNNPQSQCMVGEASYKDRCYHLVVPREDSKIDSVGFSQGEALAHCQLRKGHLLDITSQEESDFVSEWLVSLNTSSNIMTSGVGVSVMGASIWIWEGSPDSFKYSNWWPGWEGNQTAFPGTKSNRALCVIARRYFPCPATTKKETAETSFCDAEYYFWDVEDCAIMSNKHPYVCERDADDIGCIVSNGQDYNGQANVTETSKACLPWDTAQVTAALKYRVSETTFHNTLAGHNHCRNIAGSDSQPWCFIQDGSSITKEPCDIPSCSVRESRIASERSAGETTCGPNLFACEINECIPSAWVCDGQPDCKNGYDELNCTGGLAQFKQHRTSRLIEHDKEKWLHTSAANCATRCLEVKDFVCRSFSHYGKDQICLLSESNVGLSGKLVVNQSEWEYYERISYSVDCSEKFQCGNGKCINKTSACNGRNDCGDRSDERNCSAMNLGYEIRLGGSNISHEGRIEIKILGQWGYICDDQFDLRDAEVVCRELGFSLGAVEIRPHSAFVPLNTNKTLFLVDDLQCRGNETSIRECDFGGWGIHDCGNEEVVGVVCKVPGKICANNFWQCESSNECIPNNFLCDNIGDCEDGSDEDVARCKQPVAVRLIGADNGGSLTTIAGRVEVRRFGIWGTICDDDFEETEATVICHSLGYKGSAQSRKEAAYGSGQGIIWLDGVHCLGNESSIDQCLHQDWGQSDCKHEEDVSVICSLETDDIDLRSGKNSPQIYDVPNDLADDILPDNCGIVDEELKYQTTDFTPKVVEGREITRGTIPWQASLRVRTSLKSIHWCGAVILSPLHILTSAHCLQDYAKSAYFVRAGDFDTEVPEGSEQEHDIETIYIHEEYGRGLRLNNDLALIRLKGKGLQFSSYIRAVCLPPASIAYMTDINCTISGWGSNGKPGAGFSRRLKATNVPIISESECRAPYVYGEALSTGMFCAGDLQGGSDSCQGDSGGPFVCPVNGRAVLYGVTSWGHGCGRPNKPGVYTKVGLYTSWIRSKILDSLNGR